MLQKINVDGTNAATLPLAGDSGGPAWSRRPATPTDSYALTFRDRNTGEIVGQTVPLGYADSVTIGGLSSKMSTGLPYAWEVWA